MECLLRILRNDPLDREKFDDECAAMLALAEEEHVLPWAAALLRERADVLTPELENRLDQIERDAAIAAFYWSTQLKELLRALHRQNIPTVPLKGPVLAERLYGKRSLRTNCDLDLLVSRADFSLAETVLADSGFLPGEKDDYHRPWYRGSTTVELHYDVENPLAYDFGAESAIQGAHPGEFEGVPCLNFAPEDELVFLCLHATRHRFDRLCLMVDLQLAFEKLTASADPCRLRPQLIAMKNLVALGQAMANQLQPNRVFYEAVSTGGEDERLQKLANGLWNRLLAQSNDRLDWSAIHAFYLQCERPGWSRLKRRVRHLQILVTRLIGPDYRFAERFGMNREWQVHMLRPLRLLSRSRGTR